MLEKLIKVALEEEKADLVLKNATYLNVFTERFENGDIAISQGKIVGIGNYQGETEIDLTGKTVVPGFIDGHVHLESSIVSPKEFCKACVPCGTTAVVCDPHEITNVLGKTGFYYMLEETKRLPLDVYFMAPSCVPATPFDESGAEITSSDIKEMLSHERVLGLAEMMNYPGVLFGDSHVLSKISTTLESGKIIDGHAPMLSGKDLNAYVVANVTSDHECTCESEAKEKIKLGQWVMIREGTATKNLLSLIKLFEKPYSDRCMLVTDDKHAGEIKTQGHIDYIIRKAISNGANPINVYKCASFNTANYFGLKHTGAIAPSYFADFVILDDVEKVKINSVYKRGQRVDNQVNSLVDNITFINPYLDKATHSVNVKNVDKTDFIIKKEREKVIGLVPGEILTTDNGYATKIDLEKDICKVCVVERHKNTGHIGIAYLNGYGIKSGAIATSIAHDSHNIIVAGTNDEDISLAVNTIKDMQGGLVVVNNGKILGSIALPIAGLMCEQDGILVEKTLKNLKELAYNLGVYRNIDPFMTLSFTSLAVIPTLRLTTFGVVDVTKFKLLD